MALIDVDGELGRQTKLAVERVGRALGATEQTVGRGKVPFGVQRMIRWPAARTPVQRARARKRAKSQKVKALRSRAYDEAVRLIGVMEKGGNNVGAEVEAIIRSGGGRRGDPWCGWFMAHCYRKAGSKVVNGRWGAVRLYLPMSGIKRVRHPLRGNLVRFTFDHMGMVDSERTGPQIRTIEGNTGSSGAVSDSSTGGDGVYRKERHESLVRDYLHVSR